MIIIIGKDGSRRYEDDKYVLQDGEVAYIPRYLMDHDPSASGRSTPEKRYAWDGNTGFQLRRPGFRPKTLLQNGATTNDIAALDAAKQINDGYAKLAQQRAQQAEIKEHFNELQYPHKW
jgi:hypothetical protein